MHYNILMVQRITALEHSMLARFERNCIKRCLYKYAATHKYSHFVSAMIKAYVMQCCNYSVQANKTNNIFLVTLKSID